MIDKEYCFNLIKKHTLDFECFNSNHLSTTVRIAARFSFLFKFIGTEIFSDDFK